jgi:hypothetical protein
MNLSDAVGSFSDWSAPGSFGEHVRSKLDPNSTDAERFEALTAEALRFEHWTTEDLEAGCKIAHAAIKRKFPDIEDRVIEPVVRAASYDWR